LPRPAAHGSVTCECYLSCRLGREGGQEYNAGEDAGGGSGTRLLIGYEKLWGREVTKN